MQEETKQTVRELTIELCIQAIQARYKGNNDREDIEIKTCINILKRLKDMEIK